MAEPVATHFLPRPVHSPERRQFSVLCWRGWCDPGYRARDIKTMTEVLSGAPAPMPNLPVRQCPSPVTCECACHDKEHMPIGHDLHLLCAAVTWAVQRRRHAQINQRNVQRYVRVGFVKADRLLLLMDDYRITTGDPRNRALTVTVEQLPDVLAKLRALASKENGDA